VTEWWAAAAPPKKCRMTFLRVIVVALALVVFTIGCRGSRPGPPKNLPSPVLSTVVGPGDLFDVTVLGEKDIPKEYRVQPDGTIRFPYLGPIKVAGLEPQQIEELLRTRLMEEKILVSPQVTLIVKQYNSKKVSVIGAVNKPGNLPWTEGIKLVDALSQAGWFTALADSDHVILTRLVGRGKSVTALISVDAITDGQQQDVPLQAGDTIKVEQRVGW
jgi:polysaccharide export outer membrane protein